MAKYAKLKKGFKDRWVKALRSGKFPQIGGALMETINKGTDKEVEGYCCLGVATKLTKFDRGCYGLDGGNGWPTAKVVQEMFPKATYAGTRYAPAISEEDFSVESDPNKVAYTLSVLATMNDQKKSFKEIATFINRNL